MPMYTAYAINWTESESGWGQRPDGTCLFPTWKIAVEKTAEQVEKLRIEKAKTYHGRTPPEYSFPDNPFSPALIQITEGLAKIIEKEGILWIESLPFNKDGTPNPFYKAPRRPKS